MTADEIVDRWRNKPVTLMRGLKLVALCARMKVPIEDVLAQLPDKERAALLALNVKGLR